MGRMYNPESVWENISLMDLSGAVHTVSDCIQWIFNDSTSWLLRTGTLAKLLLFISKVTSDRPALQLNAAGSFCVLITTERSRTKKTDTWPHLEGPVSEHRSQMCAVQMWNSLTGRGRFIAPESTVDVEMVCGEGRSQCTGTHFHPKEENHLCLAPPCRMPQPQRSLYTLEWLWTSSWAAMAKHKLPGQSHATGSLTKPPPVFTSGEGGIKFLATSQEINKSFSTQLYNFSHTLTREDLRKSRDSMTRLFLSALFSFDSTEQDKPQKWHKSETLSHRRERTAAQFCRVENVFNHF